MKIDRLIGIITILLKNDKVTAPFLAEKFEVSRRTINRDIEDICKAGIPIITTQGYNGGISIAEGYKIDKTVLTSEELQSILIGLRSLESISDSSYINQIADKFSNKNTVISNNGNILIDLSSHYKISLTQKIEVIKTAINEEHLITFRYFYDKGEVDKIIEPYLLVFRWASWYVFGYCIEREDFRLFKLNRITNLLCMQQFFNKRDVPQEKLEFDRFFSNEIILVALFEEKVKYRLIEEYGIDSFTYIEDNRLMFKMGFSNKDNLINWVKSFGDSVQVIEPKEICLELKKNAENILKMYKEHDI
ncbi:YafY family transcriptional regulator [Clostridium sp. MSJ-11]|uniref:YafY family transcriptional regulator n=1 Tax=Clostridium mobile TaxID=2841512 RepID=A0ABS6EHV4_9CLOT|nr:YafY family protein [Clostridium mobile]MBU5484286.1 YafY family transcriptional regulator [Clostridium mobile]